MFSEEFPPVSDTFGLGCGLGMGDSRLDSSKGACLPYWKRSFFSSTAVFFVHLLVELFCNMIIRAKQRWTIFLNRNNNMCRLGGKRVGIVGLGNIGTEIAKRLESFGCVISYNSRKKKPSVPFPWYKNVYDLAVNSDVLVVCCALTEETRHMISKDVMTALGKEGVIINVGRGALIDEKELVQLLVRGELRGVGLDVFESEPDVPQELFSLDNVVLSPHCAVATPECFDALEELITVNLKAFFSNKPLQSLVPEMLSRRYEVGTMEPASVLDHVYPKGPAMDGGQIASRDPRQDSYWSKI
ncbi:hypothetical protein V6N13_036359 [Hibiscus sabdariffa]